MRSRKLAPYLFLLPNLVLFCLFILLPAFSGLYYSFTDYDGIATPKWIGFENYINILTDKTFWEIFLNTLMYAIGVVPLVFFISLGIAILLIQRICMKGLFRSIYYWPTMISFIIVGLTWKWIFGDFGILKYFTELLRLPATKWLSDPFLAKVSVVVATVWSRVGFYMVIFIAGLQAIPVSYYEAAQIDGASKFETFCNITFPLLKPTSLLVVILMFIEAFKAYPLIYALTGGGPGKSTTFLVQYIYEQGFKKGELGYASAMSVLLFLVIMIFTVIQFKWAKGGASD